MLLNARKLWLLLLPLAAMASWLMQDKPMAVEAAIYSNSVAPNNDNNFYPLEQLLSEAYVTDGNKLIINAHTEKYLSQAVNRFGLEYDQKLFAKSFPSPQGHRFGKLLHCYEQYKRVEQQIGEGYLATQAAEQFVDYRALQSLFFGELARNLFADHSQFYQNLEATGAQLISPPLTGVTAAPACAEFRGATHD